MNAFRFIGAIGLFAGSMALALIFIPDIQAGTWLSDALAAEYPNQTVQHLLGGIGAIASGGYLILFSNS